jgi:hypothetical protein
MCQEIHKGENDLWRLSATAPLSGGASDNLQQSVRAAKRPYNITLLRLCFASKYYQFIRDLDDVRQALEFPSFRSLPSLGMPLAEGISITESAHGSLAILRLNPSAVLPSPRA